MASRGPSTAQYKAGALRAAPARNGVSPYRGVKSRYVNAGDPTIGRVTEGRLNVVPKTDASVNRGESRMTPQQQSSLAAFLQALSAQQGQAAPQGPTIADFAAAQGGAPAGGGGGGGGGGGFGGGAAPAGDIGGYGADLQGIQGNALAQLAQIRSQQEAQNAGINSGINARGQAQIAAYQQALAGVNGDLGAQGAGSISGGLGTAALQGQVGAQQNLGDRINQIYGNDFAERQAGAGQISQAALLQAIANGQSGGSGGHGGGHGGGGAGSAGIPTQGDAAAIASADTPINTRQFLLTHLGGWGTNPTLQKFVSTTLQHNEQARATGGKQTSLVDAFPRFIAQLQKANPKGKVGFNKNKAGGAVARAASDLQAARQKQKIAGNKAALRGF